MEETNKSLWKNCGMTERDRKNQWRLIIWSLVWCSSWVLASLAINKNWVEGGTYQLVVAVLPTLLGIRMLFSFAKFLREADELQRKIQLDALALGFGSGLIGSVLFRLLQRAGFSADMDVSEAILLLMILIYTFGVLIGQRRYA